MVTPDLQVLSMEPVSYHLLPPKSLKVALSFSENLWTPGLDILQSKNLLVSASYIVEYRIPCLAGSSLVKDVEGFNWLEFLLLMHVVFDHYFFKVGTWHVYGTPPGIGRKQQTACHYQEVKQSGRYLLLNYKKCNYYCTKKINYSQILILGEKSRQTMDKLTLQPKLIQNILYIRFFCQKCTVSMDHHHQPIISSNINISIILCDCCPSKHDWFSYS